MWPSPWQASQVTPFSLCLLICQSATMPGVMFSWQVTHSWADVAAQKNRTAKTGINTLCIVHNLRMIV